MTAPDGTPPLSGLPATEANATPPALSLVRPDKSGAQAPSPHEKMAPAPKTRFVAVRSRRPASEAWQKLLAPLAAGEGIRIGPLGVSGSGKTTTIRNFIAAALATNAVHMVIVHDVKGPAAQYPGVVAHEADELIHNPPKFWPALRVLRRRSLEHIPSVELAAKLTLHASYHAVPTMLVVDEFSRATTPAGREFVAPSVGLLLSEGRALRASLVWSAQIPQRVPPVAFDQSRILLHRQGPRAISYLVDQNVIDARTADTVSSLKTGEFIIAAADEDADEFIYVVPPPKG